jgi:PPM family protein phosphatase
MAFHLGAQLCVVHVGDSRAYVYRDGELHQLTQDHTLMADMVRRGALQPDQVAGHRLRHVITNVVGGQELGVRSKPARSKFRLAIACCCVRTA